jgi:hypothetical protein
MKNKKIVFLKIATLFFATVNFFIFWKSSIYLPFNGFVGVICLLAFIALLTKNFKGERYE